MGWIRVMGTGLRYSAWRFGGAGNGDAVMCLGSNEVVEIGSGL